MALFNTEILNLFPHKKEHGFAKVTATDLCLVNQVHWWPPSQWKSACPCHGGADCFACTVCSNTCEEVYNLPQGGAIKLYKVRIKMGCPINGKEKKLHRQD